MKKRKFKIFVSYSRVDVQYIRPIVDLMLTTGIAIFRDEYSIPHGKRWRPIVTTSIMESETLIVFWCIHAKTSNEISKEWKYAVELDKDVVPVLLDDTPLPHPLNEYSGIDFRSFFNHGIKKALPETSIKDGHVSAYSEPKSAFAINRELARLILKRIKSANDQN